MKAFARVTLPLVIAGGFGIAAYEEKPVFEPTQPELFALGTSMLNAWADYDNDGDLDLFVGFNGVANRLYRNTGGAFEDVGVRAGVADARATRAAAWGDFDSDGDQDLVLGLAPGAGGVLRVLRNDRGVFGDVTLATHIKADSGAVRQLVWVDYDDDSDLDLFVAFRDRSNALWQNEAGAFTNVAAKVGLADRARSVGAVWFDYDEDADLDLIVGNMDGGANAIYRHDGDKFNGCVWIYRPPAGIRLQRSVEDSLRRLSDSLARAKACVYERTVERPTKSELEWGGRTPHDSTLGTVRPCAADVDGDGKIDLFFANYGTNGLFRNHGNGDFRDVSERWNITQPGKYDACAFDDFDNDGALDLYVNGTVTGGVSYRDYLFRNSVGRYVDVTPENILKLQADHGVQWADYDRDGDADLALTGSRQDGMHSLMRNDLADEAAKKSISVLVVDGQDRLTRTGAEVRVYEPVERKLLGTRLVDGGSGYNTQNQMPVRVGVGDAKAVTVEVTYPTDGVRRTVKVDRVDVARYAGRSLVVRMPKR